MGSSASTEAGEGSSEGQRVLGEELLQRMESNGDVTFIVGPKGEQEMIKGSTFVLSTLSNVFEVMFSENWTKKENVIVVPDIKPKIFRHFLKLLLTKSFKVEDLDGLQLSVEEIVEMLYVAKKYESKSIVSTCRSSIEKKITIKDVVFIYETLKNIDEAELNKKAFNFIIDNITSLMDEESFLDLSQESLKEILECERLSVRELILFKGVHRWGEHLCAEKQLPVNGVNVRKVLGDLLQLIRFPVMAIRDFYKTVHPLEILTPEEVIQISHCIAMTGDRSFENKLQYSSKLRPNVTNDSPVVTYPSLEQCFLYTPRQKMTVNRVLVECNCSKHHPQCTLKFSIVHDDGEILPMMTRELNSTTLGFNLDRITTLEQDKTYCIYYEVKKKGTTFPSVVIFKNNSSTINIKLYCTS